MPDIKKQNKQFLIGLVILMVVYILLKTSRAISRGDFVVAALMALSAVVMAAFGYYVIFIAPKKEQERIVKLKSAGIKIQTGFLRVESRRENSRDYSVIITQGIDSSSPQMRTFTSKPILTAKMPAQEQIPGTIDVYLDPQNPQNYYMDLPFGNN